MWFDVVMDVIGEFQPLNNECLIVFSLIGDAKNL